MKKTGIVTIIDNNNYGNRLQNYAVQQVLKKFEKYEVETVKNEPTLNRRTSKGEYVLRYIKNMIQKIIEIKNKSLRKKLFLKFNEENIKFSKKRLNILKKITDYEYFIVGSDQVWNPTFSRLRNFELLDFNTTAKKVAFSASFGISELPNEYKDITKKGLVDFKKISVREDAGKEIINDLDIRKDVEVLVDPTMLLTAEEWDNVARKPEQLKTNKYILNYFLGELSEERKKEINRIASENQCEVINILDKNSPFYQTGPSEFLYLEKNAFLICTDSFHSSVFAILYNRPFIVFNREDKNMSMNSRIETLINKFKLENREFSGKITNENLQHDYSKAYEILEKEKEKSLIFLKDALDIEM